eukprot:3833485-Pleurochrysis_carterae.AAC.1
MMRAALLPCLTAAATASSVCTTGYTVATLPGHGLSSSLVFTLGRSRNSRTRVLLCSESDAEREARRRDEAARRAEWGGADLDAQ